MATASNLQHKSLNSQVELLDLEPATDTLLADVLAGLSAEHKTLPSKYFYDTHGAELFEKICDLEEYYPTRTELKILQDNLSEITTYVGAAATVIEPGSGSGIKTRLLLEALTDAAAYVPIDVARDQLIDYAEMLALDFPNLDVLPVCADFTQNNPLPAGAQASANPLIYFPGSTIGNFPPEDAIALLKRWRAMLGENGSLLIGVDLRKDRTVLEAAYDDSQGVTADFNRNLLTRLNRELDADFNLENFQHYANYDRVTGAVRMWLISQCQQQVHINDSHFNFNVDEAICTEYSYKYSLTEFAELVGQAGWRSEKHWTDSDELFSLWYLTTND